MNAGTLRLWVRRGEVGSHDEERSGPPESSWGRVSLLVQLFIEAT